MGKAARGDKHGDGLTFWGDSVFENTSASDLMAGSSIIGQLAASRLVMSTIDGQMLFRQILGSPSCSPRAALKQVRCARRAGKMRLARNLR